MNTEQSIRDQQLQKLFIKGRNYSAEADKWRNRCHLAWAVIGVLFIVIVALVAQWPK